VLDDNIPKPWLGKTTLVLALAAAAVGVGNVFRLPYLVGEYGGLPFLAIYMATVLSVVVPILVAEVAVGSHGRGSPWGAMQWAASQSGSDKPWWLVALLQVGCGLFLAEALLDAVVWTVDRGLTLHAGALASASPADIAGDFLARVEVSERYWQTMLPVLAVVLVLASLGARVTMVVIGWLALPAMFILGLSVVDFALDHGLPERAQSVVLRGSFNGITPELALAAISSGLVTLAAGVGVGLCFGTRAPRDQPLLRSVLAAAIIDMAFALFTVLVVVSVLGGARVVPDQGLSLVFVTLPYAFGNLPLGDIYGAAFFAFLALGGCSALLALLEPAVLLCQRELGFSRWWAGTAVALALALIKFTAATGLWERSLINPLVSMGLLPVAMLGLVFFVGWVLPRPIIRGTLYSEPKVLFLLWWALLRYWTPLVLLTLMLVFWLMSFGAV